MPSKLDQIFLSEVESENIRVVEYPAAWAGFNLVSDNAANAGLPMANWGVIVAAGVITNPCWILGVSLGLPQVQAFQADITIGMGGAGAEITLATLPCGCNVWPVAEWNFPILQCKRHIKVMDSPRLAFNIRKSTAASLAGFAICHIIAAVGIGT